VIQNNWQQLIRPTKLDVVPGGDPGRTATIVAEPLERGFGLTLGNALRRVLLSSLQGAAVTAVQIDGVLHEFSSIPGVREDVTDIVLNIKSIGLRMHAEGPKRMTLKKEGPGDVKAGDIEAGADIEIMNPDLVICHLDKGAKLSMELTVEIGKGYVAATQNRPEDSPIGLIPVDAVFSPVRKVSYKVDNTRVGQFHTQLSAFIKMANNQIGVHDLNVSTGFNIASLHIAWAFLFQGHALRPFGMHTQTDGFDVEDNVRDVFAHTRN
jgi:DNA-directed RNA polymerase subunit alpha